MGDQLAPVGGGLPLLDAVELPGVVLGSMACLTR